MFTTLHGDEIYTKLRVTALTWGCPHIIDIIVAYPIEFIGFGRKRTIRWTCKQCDLHRRVIAVMEFNPLLTGLIKIGAST